MGEPPPDSFLVSFGVSFGAGGEASACSITLGGGAATRSAESVTRQVLAARRAGISAAYRNAIFIAEHGSWNRTKKTGYNVSRVVLDAKGNVVKYEPFVTGWLQGEEFWGRPADVQVAPDGSLLISDDVAGAIFKVSYRK